MDVASRGKLATTPDSSDLPTYSMKTARELQGVFATPSHCLSDAPGGQQLYTRELLATLDSAGIVAPPLSLSYDNTLKTKLRRKLRRRPYQYAFNQQTVELIASQIRTTDASLLFLNGAPLLGIAENLRDALPRTKIIFLSHGLDSTDYVHEVRANQLLGASSEVTKGECEKLGRQIFAECRALQAVDATLGLTGIEAEIHRWLGCTNSFWLPRAVKSEPLQWHPQAGRVGFVGTLDHPPNTEGLYRILRILRQENRNVTVRLVGGPTTAGEKIAQEFPFVQYLGILSDEQLDREASTWQAFLHPLFCFARGASTKLAVGISWGIPILTTTAGRRGYEWSSGSLIEANSPMEFVRQLLALCNDPSLLEMTREQVIQVGRSSPSTASNGEQLRQHIDRLVSES